jgi:hypothetical protein
VPLEPIVFHQNDDGTIVCNNPWPRATLISPMVIMSPHLAFGGNSERQGPVITKDKDIITVWPSNGAAAYRVREMTSEGDYICDLISGNTAKTP